MTILKNGTPTGFQDKNGKDIKTADRIKHTVDGSILTIDKFARAVSPLGFKYDRTIQDGIDILESLSNLIPIYKNSNL